MMGSAKAAYDSIVPFSRRLTEDLKKSLAPTPA
jgi:hypothetical protein